MKKTIRKSIIGRHMRSINKYEPHQGTQEKERRIKQKEKK